MVAPAPARADTDPVPGTLTTAEQSTTTFAVPVAPGLRPSRLSGRLEAGRGLDGAVTFSIGSRTALQVPARTGPIAFPVSPADVVSGAIDLTMTYAITPQCPDGSRAADVTLAGLQLTTTGVEQTPSSLASFFAPTSARVDVLVPADADDDLLAAGIAAVGAISARYPLETPVALGQLGAPVARVGPGQRVVRLLPASGEAATSIASRGGIPMLTLTGTGPALLSAARALGSDRLRLAGGPTSRGLAARPVARDVSLEQTFADLGTERAELSVPGTSSTSLSLPQDAFGGPVDSLRLHVEGTHSVVPEGTRAQLDTYLNGFLLDSQLLGEEPELTIDVTADDSQLRSENTLEMRLSSDGDAPRCGANDLPLQVFVDGVDSTVSAERGAGLLAGFEVFPQVLGGQLPVAIRGTGTARLRNAADAAAVVSSLQRASSAPLQVELVDPDQLVDSDRSGLLVGATDQDASDLDAPLRFSGMRLLDYAEATFQVGTNQPFAALEALEEGGRNLLVLGSWSPGAGDTAEGGTDATGVADTSARTATGADVSAALSRRAAAQVAQRGWSSLSDDLLIASQGQPVFSLGSDAVVPQDERAEERRGFVWWLIGGAVVLLLLLAWQLTRTRRRDQEVRVLVDAQQRREEAAAAPRPQTRITEDRDEHPDDGDPPR